MPGIYASKGIYHDLLCTCRQESQRCTMNDEDEGNDDEACLL